MGNRVPQGTCTYEYTETEPDDPIVFQLQRVTASQVKNWQEEMAEFLKTGKFEGSEVIVTFR